MALARKEYHLIQKRTPKRVAYVRSLYFNKDKIFLNTFWDHSKQKHTVERIKRLKFYKAAIDLMRNSTITPDTVFERNNPDVFLHRFSGQTKDGVKFYVQIKENKRNDRKDFMSVFPADRRKR